MQTRTDFFLLQIEDRFIAFNFSAGLKKRQREASDRSLEWEAEKNSKCFFQWASCRCLRFLLLRCDSFFPFFSVASWKSRFWSLNDKWFDQSETNMWWENCKRQMNGNFRSIGDVFFLEAFRFSEWSCGTSEWGPSMRCIPSNAGRGYSFLTSLYRDRMSHLLKKQRYWKCAIRS